MANRASAVAALQAGVPAGRDVTLREVPVASILQVAAWPDTLPPVRAVLREMLGIDPPLPGSSSSHSGSVVAGLSPGRYLVSGEAPDLVARLEAALPSAEAAVSDVSHGRMTLRAEGQGAEGLLSGVVAVDLSMRAFPPGAVAQTSIHHIDVVIRRIRLETFEIWCFRSFAESLVEWLLDAGAAT